ncbi:MAG: TolC family protein [Bacteroidia bacterium]|nr:TolC family protein [Bacteroidia bacterium]
MIKKYIHTAVLVFLFGTSTQAQLNFTGLDSLLSYAERNSTTIKTGQQQSLLAKWTKVAALANTVNFKSPISFSATDNLQLPVNFLPAEAFGGPAGTFRQVTLGQEYVSNFNFNPQIDIINPYNWAKVKSSSVSKEITEVTNSINKKTLFENIAAAYYNSIALQEQIILTEKSLSASDSIQQIVKNKFSLGIVREQDVNNAQVNQLNIQDKLVQLKVMYQQQLNTLKILCDISAGTQITLQNLSSAEFVDATLKSNGSLNSRYNTLQHQFAKSELRANRMSMMPVLSLFYYQGWQHNSNDGFFDSKSTWIQSQFIGLRITVPFPPDVTKMSQSYTSKINYRIAGLNNTHTELQTELNNRSLELDYDKALSGYQTAKQIFDLKNSNFSKSINQFKEGILSTDNLLIAFNDMVNSQLNVVSAFSSAQFVKSKISINNSLK